MSLDINVIRSGGIRAALNAVADDRAASEQVRAVVLRMVAAGTLKNSGVMLDQFLVGSGVNVDAVAGTLERDAEALLIMSDALCELAAMVRSNAGQVALADSTPGGYSAGFRRTW